ncbi:Gleya adhesin domain protein [Lasiodiplodia theobromae]|uniref:Gleya adhesin domain protein n=1 Tax=Lasiodiplodia theobromae TaxID=45133 RepID=UPI0015C2F78E|nr:Gleya adhesin domain protein [Lasiodiplodia theobromae]KAF4535209.1 Gleya adhesin domain protein [Lasiodiplodia theobromae]
MRYSPLVALPLAVSASPLVQKDLLSAAKSAFCSLNNNIVTALKQQSTATSYCSSYLSIATKTLSTTSTVTPTSVHVTTTSTVTGDPYITTETATETTSTDLYVTSTVVETDTTTLTLTTSTVTLSCLSSAYTAAATTSASNEKRGNVQNQKANVQPPKQLQRANVAQNQRAKVAQPRANVQKPACLPSTWAAPAISSACSCLSIPTPSTTTTITTTLVAGTVTDTATQTLTPTETSTVTTTETSTNTVTDYTTTTTTTTETAYATATTISTSGLAYRKYTHSYNADSSSSGFTSTYFKTASVDFSGTIEDVDFSSPNWPSGSRYITLPGNSQFDSAYAAVLMNGFFVAPTSGTYTISSSSSSIDNWGYLWKGDVAYSTWSDSNTAYQASRTGAGYIGGSTSFTLSAGDAIPMTLLWANGGGVGQSTFIITLPSGSTVSDSTGYFAPGCDAVFS